MWSHNNINPNRSLIHYYLNVILTVGYFRRRGGINLIDTGKWYVLFSSSYVWNIVEGPLWLEGPVHEHIGVETEHL